MAVKNKLSDLNNFLFAQLERLDDDELKEKDLQLEIKRAKAMADVGARIIDIANVTVQAARIKHEYGVSSEEMSNLLENK